MNVNLLQGLPATSSPAGDAAPGDANAALRRHRAWQSAMEQAQLANWFKPGGEAGAPGQPPAPPLVWPISALGPAMNFASQPALGETGDGAPDAPEVAQPELEHKQVSAKTPREQLAAPVDSGVPGRGTPAASVVPASGNSSVLPHSAGAAPSATASASQQFTAMGAAPAMVLPTQGARIELDFVSSEGVLPAGIRMAPAAPAANAQLARAETVPPLRSLANYVAQLLDAPEVEATESTAAPDAPSPRMDDTETPGAATRLHVEWTRDGARLWLGVDQDQLQRVPTLIGQLQQWLASSGVKLLALVCNGRTVYQARRAFVPDFPPQGDFA